MRKPNYDKFPFVAVTGADNACVTGWPAVSRALRDALNTSAKQKTVMAVECYPGVNESEIVEALGFSLDPARVIRTADALRPESEINALCGPFLGGDDPVFGFLCGLELQQFFDPERLQRLREKSAGLPGGLVLIVGVGATWVHEADLLVYADLGRWEIQKRQRRNEISNLGVNNAAACAKLKYKRAFFIDWRVADRWKAPLLARADFFLDTHHPAVPKLVEGTVLRRGLVEAAHRPFRVVPFFDPGVWGGQWMKKVCDLDRSAPNFAWGFDCVPEENSLLLGFGQQRFELPALDLVLNQTLALLGERVQKRFGAEFPIRFDLLDTMGGENLSFQVHPDEDYIRKTFGMAYTQDESYYILESEPDAVVYLGLKENVDRDAMIQDLKIAQQGGGSFQDEQYVNRIPAKKHDHFLIPAGTVHCSGAGIVVLEISATPYIFTFKMWDWDRLGLDGVARPIHLEHGAANINWNRSADWVGHNLVNRIETLATGDGWREERTGLHELEFIETRRHWFTQTVPHHTDGGVQVIHLVAGEEIIVESPSGAFEPFVVHYAETFIVPAAVGAYSIRPHGLGIGQECATIKASIRA